MTLDEFFRRVASAPDREVRRTVRVHAPEVLEELRRRDGTLSSDLEKDPRYTLEERVFRYGHRLGPGVSDEALDAWARSWPRHRLPIDLVAMLRRVDGIHLSADLETGRSYRGLAPLAEWALARTTMYGPNASPHLLDDRYLAVSYHTDGAAFVVLNVDSARYFLMDSCGPDEAGHIGDRVDDLLDWLWAHRLPRLETL